MFHSSVEEKWEIFVLVLLLSYSCITLVCLILVLSCSCVAPILVFWYNHTIHLIHPSSWHTPGVIRWNYLILCLHLVEMIQPYTIAYLTHAHSCCNHLWGFRSDIIIQFSETGKGGGYVCIGGNDAKSIWSTRTFAAITYEASATLLVTFLFSLVSDVSANYEGNAVYFGGQAI